MATRKKAEPQEVSVIDQVLALEGPVTDAARAYPSHQNSDAEKHTLMGVASAISQFRNARETTARLELPAEAEA